MQAIIPIAGLGSRFLPATKCIPKEMLPVFNKPVIEIIVSELVESGVKEIIFVIPKEGSITPNHFLENKKLNTELVKKNKISQLKNINNLSRKISIRTVIQENPKGDGDAILKAKHLIDSEKFFVFFGDEILDNNISAPRQLLNCKKYDCNLGIVKVDKELVSRFGIVTPEKNEGKNFKILDFVEKPNIEDAPSNLALIGKNICCKEVFNFLEKIKKSNNEEIRLIDALILMKENFNIQGTILEGKRFDTGNPQGLLEASIYYSNKKF